MLKKDQLESMNRFRHLCLKNAEDAVRAAEVLQSIDLFHFAYHLAVLSLEEIAKIFIAWHQSNRIEKWDRETMNIPLDDHVKKIFWAIWFPSMGSEIITKELWNETKNLASSFHKKRLDAIYTDISDTIPSVGKIQKKESEQLISFTKARLQLAKIDGEYTEGPESNSDLDWFTAAVDSTKSSFIFGDKSQEKLIELGDPKAWIKWLIEHFKIEEAMLHALAEKEFAKEANEDSSIVPKWKVKIKIITPSHSIRAKELQFFNSITKGTQLFKGNDNHTLFAEFTFGDSIHITQLWGHGWIYAKLFVAGLNISTNGLFYWEVPIDRERYYESILDIESDKRIDLTVNSGLNLNWSERKMVLSQHNLEVSLIAQAYFLSINSTKKFAPVNHYLKALGLFAKSDIHFSFEKEVFYSFFQCLKTAMLFNEILADNETLDIIARGHIIFAGMLNDMTNFDRIIEIGISFEKDPQKPRGHVSVGDVILMKQYCGFYLLTLGARQSMGDQNLLLAIS